jgi:hypothetical protein
MTLSLGGACPTHRTLRVRQMGGMYPQAGIPLPSRRSVQTRILIWATSFRHQAADKGGIGTRSAGLVQAQTGPPM